MATYHGGAGILQTQEPINKFWSRPPHHSLVTAKHTKKKTPLQLKSLTQRFENPSFISTLDTSTAFTRGDLSPFEKVRKEGVPSVKNDGHDSCTCPEKEKAMDPSSMNAFDLSSWASSSLNSTEGFKDLCSCVCFNYST